MSRAKKVAEESPPKSSKLPIILGACLALVGGGGGFYAAWSGMIPGSSDAHASAPSENHTEEAPEAKDVAFVPVDPITVSLPPSSSSKHLIFRAQLETSPEAQSEVVKLLPRVTDVLNSYLRALEPKDIENPAALTRLRAQMLRRVQVVTGANKVDDLLIMEFILN